MSKKTFVTLLLPVALIVFIGSCDYEGGNESAQWKVPLTEVPQCLKNIVNYGDSDRWIGIPLYVYRYRYQGEYYYYLYADCCDQYNYLLDGNCEIICAPDGGFSGAGDGRCPDYYQYLTSEELIWCKDAETCNYLDDDFRV